MADQPTSKTVEQLQTELKLLKDQNAEIKNRVEQDKEILAIKREQRKILEEEEKLQTRIKELQKIIAEDKEGTSDAEKELVLTLQIQVQKLKIQTAELEKQAEIIKKAKESAKELANSFSTIFSGKAPELKGALDPKNLMSVAEKMKDIQAGGMAAAKVFAGTFAVEAVLTFTKAIVDLAIDLGDAEAKFMKSTGANQDFARSVTNSYNETRKFGASIEETSKAYEDLYTGFTDFTFMAKEQRESLAETSAVLNKLGISNTDFAKSVQISTKALGMSAEQAGQNMLNIEKFAEEIGVAPQMLGQQFAGAGEMMAKMGDQGVDAFKDLAIASKITGLEMEKILRITDKFDTFAGAAGQAGKLNAALGGNFVNAMDLMMATDPVERFNMIRDSLLNAGLSFDDMSYYQKKFYADSLELGDVSELALVMSGNMDTLSESTKQTEQSYVDAAKRANEMQGFQDKLNTAFAQMIPILTPLIDLFVSLTTSIVENANVVKFLGYTIVVLSAAYVVIQGLVKGYNLVMGVTNLIGLTRLGGLTAEYKAKIQDAYATRLQTKAQKNLNDTGQKGNQISANSIKMMIAIGAAALMLGIGIGLAAYGTAQLAAAFEGLGDAAPYAAAGIMLLMVPFAAFFAAAAFIVYSGVGPGIAAVFLAMGAAALLLGAGIAVAAYGMSFLVKAFTDMDPKQIIAISVAMIAFSAAMNTLAVAGMTAMIGAPGLVVLTAAIVGMAYGLSLIEELITNVANAFVSFFDTIANPNTASNIKEIAQAIEAIPTRKNIEFATSMGALAAANTAAAALGTVQAVSKTISGREETVRQPIQITLNGDKMAEFVVEVIGKEIRTVRAGG